jgi:amino acid adenylation domain-containing protein
MTNTTQTSKGGLAGVGKQSIRRRDQAEPCPLSFTQESLWFLSQLEPDSPAYNQPKAIRLSGALNAATLKQALDAILARHEALRTTFVSVDGNPVQMIGPVQPVELSLTDLSAIPAEEREAQLDRCLLEVTDRLFNLSQDLMLRAALFRLDRSDHVLLLVTHHIASDGWSTAVLFRELAALYEAFSAGKPSPLSELPIQYADYVVWQRQWLQGEVLERNLSYWRQRLAGISVLELPTDRPRPPVQSHRGAHQSFSVPKRLSQALKALSRQERVTLFMVLLAAFKVLLHRYTGQDDIAVGSPITGRTHLETEGLIGFLVNTLVLRTDVSENPNFRDLLKRVREVCLGAYAHSDVPFEKLMPELKLERTLSRNPLFQVMFALRNYPRLTLRLPGLTVSPLEVQNGTAKFDLGLAVSEEGEGLTCSLEYNTDLFEATTISRMLGHFQILLQGIAANPDGRVSDLPLLTESEQDQLLVEWNDTRRDYPQKTCIHELFEAQVDRTPEAIALQFEGKQLNYKELNARANQVAHYLQKSGMGAGALVGIYMDRSFETVVGLLGVLKAGGAYVPLDPVYPKERLAFLLDDTQVRVLLTRQSLSGELPTDHRIQAICMDTAWTEIAAESRENPGRPVTADHLAYVIYTSGSTGKPKGVEITHGALTNFACSASATFGLTPNDRVLQFASISFDTAAEEIFPCLIQGAGLVLRTDSMLDSVSGFLQKCSEWGITVLDLPTFYWHELTEELSSKQLTIPEQLRLLIIGGERAVPARLAQWQGQSSGHVRLLNTYGPTEATVVATMWELAGAAQAGALLREVPIGRPILNVQTYVLDKHLNAAPIGVHGELYIGGAGLARGYLNCPELTAEKFIPNPFSDQPGAGLYKTGDMARYLPDGNIEFLGRIDHQVKIRGFRIELGEIEAVLARHAAVRETVVVAREDVPGDRRLVAYVVASQESAPTMSELRGFLQKKLPDYMVPSAFVVLDSLPLTPNGKIDRNALPARDQVSPELDGEFVAPRTPVEEVLAGIWAEVLKLERVGINDNFFELGGHSLLATQALSRVNDAFETDLPLRSFFESPTVAALAAALLKASADPVRIEKTALLLLELSQLSEGQVKKMLDEKTSRSPAGENQ